MDQTRHQCPDPLLGVLDRWRGVIRAPQEDRELRWPSLVESLGDWHGASEERPYVCTGFAGTDSSAAAALLLLWSAGYAPAPLDLRLDARSLATRIRLLQPARVLASRRQADLVREAVSAAGLRDSAIRVLDDDPHAWGSSVDLQPRPVVGSDPGLVIFTSGTTGVPKAVLLTRDNLAAVAAAVAGAQHLGPDDHVLNALSLAHVNAPVIALLATARSGGNVTLLRRADPGELWRLAETLGVTWANLAPPLIATLARHPAARGARATPRLRFVRSASAPLPPTTANAFEELFGTAIVESYGISEAASQVTINDVPPGPRRHGWVGWPRNAELRVVDESGRDLGPGHVGDVLVRGPGVMAGYLGDPAASAAVLRGGWLATGDLGELDETGALRLVGRRAEMINRGGEKIAPRVVEEALLRHPDVSEVAVVGVPDPVYGQEIKAFVVARQGAQLSDRTVRGFARSVLPLHMRPRSVEMIAELPRTPAGKIARRVLAEVGAG